MTAPVVVLVEEPSARIVVDALCKTLGISEYVQVLEHQGKADLERSIARKINGWKSDKPTHFIITRDLDGADRADLKEKLLSLVPDHAKRRAKVRLVIPELEGWYLGDPNALVAAGFVSRDVAIGLEKKARFRDLCVLSGAKAEFRKLIKSQIGQIDMAHTLGPLLNPVQNRSRNFSAFVSALKWGIGAATSSGMT